MDEKRTPDFVKDDDEITRAAPPRFDEQAREAARPVKPLARAAFSHFSSPRAMPFVTPLAARHRRMAAVALIATLAAGTFALVHTLSQRKTTGLPPATTTDQTDPALPVASDLEAEAAAIAPGRPEDVDEAARDGRETARRFIVLRPGRHRERRFDRRDDDDEDDHRGRRGRKGRGGRRGHGGDNDDHR